VKSRLFTLLAALSLLLFLVICTLWVRSYFFQEKLTWITVDGYRSVWTAEGSLEISLFQQQNSYKPNETAHPKYSSDTPNPPFNGLLILDYDYPLATFDWQHAGFAWHQVRETRFGRLHASGFAPFWSLALLTALLPAIWTSLRFRSQTREKSGRCAKCGYDLRATPDRCPECGEIAQKAV
jgi:hypothetical protein